jgi:hypothetical protein
MGKGLNTLTTASFFDTLSDPPGIGAGAQAFVARFRGFIPEGSDKVPGVDPPALQGVPEPSSLLLVGVGGGSLALMGWKRRRRRQAGAEPAA